MQASLHDPLLQPCLGSDPVAAVTQEQVEVVFRNLEDFRDKMANAAGTRRPLQRPAELP